MRRFRLLLNRKWKFKEIESANFKYLKIEPEYIKKYVLKIEVEFIFTAQCKLEKTFKAFPKKPLIFRQPQPMVSSD